jgi:hypothetical protein
MKFEITDSNSRFEDTHAMTLPRHNYSYFHVDSPNFFTSNNVRLTQSHKMSHIYMCSNTVSVWLAGWGSTLCSIACEHAQIVSTLFQNRLEGKKKHNSYFNGKVLKKDDDE